MGTALAIFVATFIAIMGAGVFDIARQGIATLLRPK